MLRKHANLLFQMFIAFTLLCLCSLNIWAAEMPMVLKKSNVQVTAGNKVQVFLEFNQKPKMPKGFSMDAPSKIVFDFPGVSLDVPRGTEYQKLDTGVAKAVTLVDTSNKTRLVVDVVYLVPYVMDIKGNTLVISLAGDIHKAGSELQSEGETAMKAANIIVENVDFRRGSKNEGRLIVDLSHDSAPIDFKEEGDKIVTRFIGAKGSPDVLRLFDVSDFGTPVKSIHLNQATDEIVMDIEASGVYEKIAYQIDNQFIVEVRPVSQEEKDAIKIKKFEYTGERLSLNFQDIEVRSVLQLFAEFTDLNIVTSDTVQGNVTLRLDNVPWDQALDFILKSKGLAKRESGNIMLIAPQTEIALQEQQELEDIAQTESLAPLKSEYFQLNYSKAEDLQSVLKGSETNSVLSERGSVTVDARTNTLLVQDTASKLDEVRDLLAKLDVPVKQVEIATHIVSTSESIEDVFGVQWAASATAKIGSRRLGLAPTNDAARSIADAAPGNVASQLSAGRATQLFIDLAQDALPKGAAKTIPLGFALSRLPGGTLLDLELQALERESRTNVVSKPKIITSDQSTATIESGIELPYAEATSSGAASASFKKATLKLEVTPQITPDDKIFLELSINNDSKGEQVSSGVFAINTTTISTNVLVENGNTVVIGGVFSNNSEKAENIVPFVGRLPILGRLFRNTAKYTKKDELVIFVTPKILSAIL